MLVAFVGEDEALDHVTGAAVELAQGIAVLLVVPDGSTQLAAGRL
jgi:hypothetical protein